MILELFLNNAELNIKGLGEVLPSALSYQLLLVSAEEHK